MEHSYSNGGYERDVKREYQVDPSQITAPPIHTHNSAPAALPSLHHQHPHPHQHQQHQHQQVQTPTYAHAHASSTPSTQPAATPGSPQSSPFAFAPPPLSQSIGGGAGAGAGAAAGRPADHQYYYAKPQPGPPYYGSAPMSYRSHSTESRPSPQQAARQVPGHVHSTPAQHAHAHPHQHPGLPPMPQQSGSSPYSYPRPSPQFQHQPSSLPPPRPYGAYAPMASEMPRSLSYHAGYQPYPYATPLPSLNRHNTTSGLEMGRPMGYSFANRLPLTDRPFKCDECVQSFNRNHDLKRHKRIHLSVKPFGCDKCGKTFSRKDALRRHWLVKGCRGEEGATAPITPIFPINGTPGLSPPTPPMPAPGASSSGSGQNDFPPPLSFGHPSAPPPLGTLPSRQPSDQSSLIVTPHDSASAGMSRDSAAVAAPLDEPMIDPSLQASQRGSGSSDGYFEGVVGIKQDGTALLERRSPKPTFAMPFYQPHAQSQAPPHQMPMHAHQHQHQHQHAHAQAQQMQQQHSQQGLMAPEMEKRGSQQEVEWQGAKWHRPSFPFPPRHGNYYDNEPSPETPVAAPAYTG